MMVLFPCRGGTNLWGSWNGRCGECCCLIDALKKAQSDLFSQRWMMQLSLPNSH